MSEPSDNLELKRLQTLRLRQQREAARGCLIVLVFEGASVLAVALWVLAVLLEMPRLQTAAVVAFLAFTVVSILLGVMLLVRGNFPGQRRLRRDHEQTLRQDQTDP